MTKRKFAYELCTGDKFGINLSKRRKEYLVCKVYAMEKLGKRGPYRRIYVHVTPADRVTSEERVLKLGANRMVEIT